MDNNETRPLEDWRANNNQQSYNNDYRQSYPPQYQQYGQAPQYNHPQQYAQSQYGQYTPSYEVPEEVANMRIAKLVWSFILFWPLAIPSLIFFIRAKSSATIDPNQAVYFAERFNFFSRLAIKTGIIILAVVVLVYTIIFALTIFAAL